MNDRTFELKRLSPGAIEAALQRGQHYRYLSQPHLAESICRDILDAAPDHEAARIMLIKSLSDQFRRADTMQVTEVLSMASDLPDAYDRAYITGIVCERRAEAALVKGGPVAGAIAYEWFTRAMDAYAEAEPLRPDGNDDALLRWNTCARILNTRQDVRPREEEPQVEMLE